MIGDEMNAESSAKIDTGLACFAIMANYFEKPLSLEQVKHKYDRQNSDFEEYELLQLAKEFSFKAKFVKNRSGPSGKDKPAGNRQDKDNRYFIIGKIARRQSPGPRSRRRKSSAGMVRRTAFAKMERQALDDDLP